MQFLQGLLSQLQQHYPENPQREQAVILFYLCILCVLFSSLTVLINLLIALVSLDLSFSPGDYLGVGGIMLGIVVYALLRAGYIRTAAYSFVMAVVVITLFPVLFSPQPNLALLPFIPLVVAAFILNWRILILLTPVTFVMLIWNLYGSNTAFTNLSTDLINDMAIVGIGLAGIVSLLALFSLRFQRLAAILGSEAGSLKLASQFTLDIETDEFSLLMATINFVRGRTDYHSVQVFMINELGEISTRIHMDLGVAASEALSEDYFAARQQNAIVETLRNRKITRIPLNANYLRRAHLHSDSRVALCIPVIYDKTILAILDVQSENRPEITPEDVILMEYIAGELAEKLYYLRKINALQSDISAGEEIMLNQQRRLRELEQLERQSVQQTWRRFMQERGDQILGFDLSLDDTSPVQAVDMSDTLESTLNQGDIMIDEDTQRQFVNIPINLRGQVLGAVGLEIPARRALNQRQIDMLENVMQRLAMALENKRLYEQSQSQAQRESKASNIGGQLLESTDVETILQMAAERFNNTLGAIQTHIQIEPDVLQRDQNDNQFHTEGE